ncbi:MAG: hypothetical protein OXJ37_13620 [Bryobacterales bacterium]|nr:hypothetical protein [Bryobacterales bacterium]MDE0263437.1 hypothetical protein [Bryobacterales bacterium]MDE0623277.1 hypothetical protein [Bryobacterales bacterium]
MTYRITLGMTSLVLGWALAAAADIPRTSSGKPDLSGTYDIATLTPLERPEEYGERLTLTDEEAAGVVDREVERRAERNAPSDPQRGAPPEGGDGSPGSAGNVGGYNSFWLDRGSGGFKLDGTWRTSIITDPKNGRKPPMTAAAKQRAAARAELSRTNTGVAWWVEEGLEQGPYDDPEIRPLAERCLLGFGSTAGPPMLPVAYNNVKRIVQTDEHVMILVEMVHDARIIRMNAEHAPDDVRSWLGDSIGHWEGDTLVVETTNFNDSPSLPGASRDLRVTEWFTRVDPQTLHYRFRVEDPSVWTAPWSGEYVWPATGNRVYEYACHEANYSFGGILRGARILEEELLGKKGGD